MRVREDHLQVVRFIVVIVLVICFPILTGCGSGDSSNSLDNQVEKINSGNSAWLKLSLTDAPTPDLTSVVVNVSHLEVLLEGQGKKGRLIVAENLGYVDLLTLQNGVTLPLADVAIPDGVRATQVRLVLKSEGHYGIKGSGDICELATPSGQQSGVKIVFSSPIRFDAGNTYSLLIDFDALKSVVVKGNGGCLLKPVLKLKEATVQEPGDDPDAEEDGIVVKLPNEGEENESGVNNGWEPEGEGEALEESLYDWELENFF
ncbi:MAG: DUF4382 domain-containing protein [Bdellovibrionaceae bacterium]|nr:DUF4382 domain-containing protein [Pseudobdellovibrionaceae bacterium]